MMMVIMMVLVVIEASVMCVVLFVCWSGTVPVPSPSLLYIPVLCPSTQRTIQSKQVHRDVHRERESWYDGDTILHGRLMSEDKVWIEIHAHDREECVRDVMKRCVLFDIWDRERGVSDRCSHKICNRRSQSFGSPDIVSIDLLKEWLEELFEGLLSFSSTFIPSS